MVEVRCEYINAKSKNGKNDYFIYTDIEVKGHADHTGYTNNIKVCAGISAICYGINRLMNDRQYAYVCDKGYFHVWTEKKRNLKGSLDRDSVYALNTLVCQLFEIYNQYPNAFKSFDLIDIKEKIENERKTNEYTRNTKPYRKRKQRLGFYSLIQETLD